MNLGGLAEGHEEKCYRANFKGVPEAKDRKCTDLLCLGVFATFFIGMVVIFGVAVKQSGGADGYRRLLGGMQVDGRICGLKLSADGAGEDYKQAYFFNAGDLREGSPGESGTVIADLQGVLCVKQCPGEGDEVEGRLFSNDTDSDPQAVFATAPAGTKTFLFHYCQPNDADGLENSLFKEFLDDNQFAMTVLSTENVWPIFLIGGGMAIALSIGYILLMRKCAGVITWFSVLAILACFVATGAFLWQNQKDIKFLGSGKEGWYQAVAIGLWAIAAIILAVVVYSRKKIALAIDILEEATEAVMEMPTVFLIPFVKIAILGVFLLFWIAGAVYLMSAGDLKMSSRDPILFPNGVAVTIREMEWNDTLRKMFAYHFFGLLWGVAFIVALGQLMLSFAGARWYFSFENSSGKREVSSPVFGSMYMSLRFHVGSMALGSFLVALMQFIRWWFEYLDKQATAAGQKNVVVEKLLCICKCCVTCFEKIIKFINKQAFIAMAIFGTSFCKSAGKAFGLISRNFVTVGALNLIGELIEMLGAVSVSAMSTFMCYLILDKVEYFSSRVGTSILVTLVLVALSTFLVARFFMQIFGHTADVLLMCYTADEEMNGGTLEFAPDSLKSKVQQAPSSTEPARM